MVTVAVSPKAHNLTTPAVEPRGLLRFITAGSVDDGKSTMIGRLLYDAQSVYEDQLLSIQKSRINRADGPIDFSLLTDGLRAEREQGITIDVAYRYFSTPRRKFIIADTPGHEQYTRNMVTGASTAEAAVILIDARKGLLAQSRRHAYIASLLGIQNAVAAINKMDLVEYREEVFREIARDFQELARRLGIPNTYAIPISALKGDGIVSRSVKMPWFDGPPLLEHLENIPGRDEDPGRPLRLPVQCVIRPNSHFRGFAGQIASGRLQSGAKVIAFPSGIETRVKAITTFDGELNHAAAGDSITLTLEDEIDLSRGDLLVSEGDLPKKSTKLKTSLVWLHPDPSRYGHDYLLKHTTRIIRARLERIVHRVDVNTLDHLPASALRMNDIASVEIETAKPLFFDPYRQNRMTGSFILIDLITNATVAAGMIEGSSEPQGSGEAIPAIPFSDEKTGYTAGKIYGKEFLPALIWAPGRPSVAENLERALLQEGWPVQLVSALEFGPAELKAIATILRRKGVITLLSLPQEDHGFKQIITSIFGEELVFTAEQSVAATELPASVLRWLHDLQNRLGTETGRGHERRID